MGENVAHPIANKGLYLEYIANSYNSTTKKETTQSQSGQRIDLIWPMKTSMKIEFYRSLKK